MRSRWETYDNEAIIFEIKANFKTKKELIFIVNTTIVHSVVTARDTASSA